MSLERISTFNSLEFLAFFALVAAAYFALAPRRRWMLLLAASYLFYMSWNPAYVLLILLSTAIDYTAGRLMGRCPQRRGRRKWLAFSLAGNLGLLFLFKYYNFFHDSLGGLADRFALSLPLPAYDFLLPVGISFYTFQSLSYTIDVYRGRIAPEKHAGLFALYVAFFPQLVAGPIERAGNLLAQLHKGRLETSPGGFDYQRVTTGLKRIGWGLIKKVVIADRLATLVSAVYNDPTGHEGPAFVLATFLFAYQIYCDFSAYSDIAIGAAQILGVRLMENFDRPYHAASITDFWRRWHISLSTWFRDYVYIPLGGNQVGAARWCFNLLVTFLISGLWHGANWTFVVWGLLHGVYLIAGIYSAPLWTWTIETTGLRRAPKLKAALQTAVVFLLVCFAWIFFRAGSVADAFYIVSHLGTGWGSFGEVLFDPAALKAMLEQVGLTRSELLLCIVCIGALELSETWRVTDKLPAAFCARPAWIRWSWYYAAVSAAFLWGKFGEQEFIYFQF